MGQSEACVGGSLIHEPVFCIILLPVLKTASRLAIVLEFGGGKGLTRQANHHCRHRV